MFYKCEDCGAWFDKPDIREIREYREFWGAPCYETMYEERCPKCGSEYIEEVDDNEEE